LVTSSEALKMVPDEGFDALHRYHFSPDFQSNQ